MGAGDLQCNFQIKINFVRLLKGYRCSSIENERRMKIAQHVTRKMVSAIKYADFLKMNHNTPEEITVQSIQTMKAFCIQMHLDLFIHHGDEFPCHNLFGLPLVNHQNILGLFGMQRQ